MGLHYLPYDVNAYKKICDGYIQKNNITVYYNSSIKSVEHNSNVISSAIIKNEKEEIEITFSSIIDCSGTSVVSDLIQLPLIEDSTYQAAAQVFTISDIEPIAEAQLGMVLIKSLASAIDKKILPAYFDRVYVVQGSVKNGDVSLKLGIPIEVTYQGNNEHDIKIKAKEMVHTLFDFLVKQVDVFKKSHLKSIAPEVGFRVGKRAEGNYILLAEDVLQSRKFEDAIAVGAWPIEKWGMDKRVQMVYFEEGDYYQIPFRCLKSKYINNLFFAGRSISADNEAIASARVMGICFQTGYAAGMYACASVLGLSEELILKKIQNIQL